MATILFPFSLCHQHTVQQVALMHLADKWYNTNHAIMLSPTWQQYCSLLVCVINLQTNKLPLCPVQTEH